MKNVIAPKRAKLTDLFVVGKQFDIDDGNQKVTVWMQKLNEAEKTECAELANVAKAKVQVIARPDVPDDNPKKARFLAQLEVFETREELISLIAAKEITEKRISCTEMVANRDEWKEEDYLKGLQESWNNEMRERFENDEEDEEARRVYEELLRFTEEVNKEVKDAQQEIIDDYSGYNDETLRAKALEALFIAGGNIAWSQEYNRQQLFMSLRDPDNHKEYLLDSVDDLGRLSDEVLAILVENYESLQVDPVEGKE